MKKSLLITATFVAFALLGAQSAFGQLNTSKICPGSQFWKSNTALVEDKKEMYETYALGPDGCWWRKTDNFKGDFKEGYYQFDLKGTKYYYNKRKDVWENKARTACLSESPFNK